MVIYEFQIHYSVVTLSSVVGLHMVLEFVTMLLEVTTKHPDRRRSIQAKDDGSGQAGTG